MTITQHIRDAIRVQCEKKNYYTLPFYYVIATLILCLTIFGRPLATYEIPLISLFIVTAPNMLLWYFEAGPALVLQTVFLSVLGFCFKGAALYIVGGIAVVSVAYTGFLIAWNFRYEVRNWADILGCLMFSFLNFQCGFSLAVPYDEPINPVSRLLLTGAFITDDSMRCAIANMMLNQFVPSTGLHLTPYLRYHFLGDFFIAAATGLSGRHVYDIYYFQVPLLVIPYLIFVLLMTTRRIGRKAGGFLLVPIILFGIPFGRPHPWYEGFDSGFLIGAILMLSYLLLMMRGAATRWIVMIAGYPAKVSAGIAMTAALIVAELFEAASWGKRSRNLLAAVVVSSACFLWVYAPGGAKGQGAFRWGAYYYQLFPSNRPAVWLFLWDRFSLSFIFCGMLCLEVLIDGANVLSKKKPLLIMVATSAALGLIMINAEQEGNSQSNFVNSPQWLLLPVVAAMTWDWLWHRSRAIRITAAVGILTLALPLAPLIRDRISSYRHYKDNHLTDMAKHYRFYTAISGEKLSPDEKKERFLPYYDALLEAGRLDKNKEYLVEIPESETDFWLHSIYPSPRYWMAFYIPAISGRPAWNAYNYRFMKNTPFAGYPPGSYGYGAYYGADVDDFCQGGFRGVIRIAKNAAGIVQPAIIHCPA